MQSFERLELVTYFCTITSSVVIGLIQGSPRSRPFSLFLPPKEPSEGEVSTRVSHPGRQVLTVALSSSPGIYRGNGLAVTLQWNSCLVTGECPKKLHKIEVSPHANLFALEKFRDFYCPNRPFHPNVISNAFICLLLEKEYFI